MMDIFNADKPQKEPTSPVNLLIAGIGIVFMLCACSMIPLILVRNMVTQLTIAESEPIVSAEKASYDGKRIQTVPADSKQIEALAYSYEVPVVVMFDADWWRYCKNLRPRLEREIESQSRDMMLLIVNVDDCPAIKKQYHMSGVPTVIAFMNGQEVDRFVGEHDQAYVQQFLEDLPTPN